ncbi:MAG: FHA domain-containing protein [Anaerolineae bacterium]|jgi:hypothetical protein|nr:FHA domain-containing protein [Anaerolineae bacterium]
MSNSHDDHILRLEARLERWIESTFAAAFGPRLDVFDLALHLARAMEGGVRHEAGTPHPVAPDVYRVTVHDGAYARLREREAEVIDKLAAYLVSLAAQNEYRLSRQPAITLTPDPTCQPHHPQVSAQHTDDPNSGTAGLAAVNVPSPQPAPPTAHLLINGQLTAPLVGTIINIGRMEDNDVTIDDPYVSRHHVQIRQRGSDRLLFDVGSTRGTRINGRPTQEHRLRSGDVIEIGRSRLIYIEDRPDEPLAPPTDTLEQV